MKHVLAGIGLFALTLVGLTVFIGWGALIGRPVATYTEETRRQVYDQSRAYRDGMAVDLDGFCREYRFASDPGEKAVLAETIRLRTARFDGPLPSHIEECINEVR